MKLLLTLLIIASLSLANADENSSFNGQDSATPFNNRSLAAWTTIGGKAIESGWEVVDGVIHRKRDGRRAGNIVTADEFAEFSLSFEWKISPGGNSGIKYRVRDYDGRLLGCEYQIYDDDAKKKPQPNKSTGALYDLYEPNAEKKLNPAGEWNHGKIVVRGNQIEHWLNKKQIVAATIGDEEWSKRLGKSKFNDVTDFSRNPRGKIMLTDHGSEVWYRNIVFESLEVTASPDIK
jgi:Domain of Unknown Function (DUF1080)